MQMPVGLECWSKARRALAAHPFRALRLPEKFPKLVFGLCRDLCIQIACRIRKFNIISIITKGRWAQRKRLCLCVFKSVARVGRVCAERMHAVFSFQVALSLSGYLKTQIQRIKNCVGINATLTLAANSQTTSKKVSRVWIYTSWFQVALEYRICGQKVFILRLL